MWVWGMAVGLGWRLNGRMQERGPYRAPPEGTNIFESFDDEEDEDEGRFATVFIVCHQIGLRGFVAMCTARAMSHHSFPNPV